MKRPLDRYAEKRAFTRTPEPAPKLPTDRRGPLLFVIQKHAARRLHYDFRLEVDGVLKSWAVPKGPSLEYGDKRLAVEVEDHPFDYGSFEGVIPAKEYGAGNVIVWDCGVYSPDEDRRYSFGAREEAQERVRTELAQGKLSFFLRGEKLKGSFALVRTSSDKQWLLLKHKDRFASSSGTDVLARSRSVLSGRSLDELAASNGVRRLDAAVLAPTGPSEAMPKKLDPMLAEIGEQAQTDPQWLYEPKVDGYRVIAFVQDGTVRLQSRRGIDLTDGFSGNRRRPRGASGRLDDRRRRDRCARCKWPAVVQRPAESPRAEDAAGTRRRTTRGAGRAVVLRPAALRRHESAQRAVHRPAPLPVAMLAADGPFAAGSHVRQRGEAIRRVARRRLRRDRGQAQGQSLPAGQTLGRVAEDQVDADGGVRRRWLHEGQGRTRGARLVAARLLERQQAAFRRARGLRPGRPGHRGTRQALCEARAQGAAIRREAAAAAADDVARSGARRRGEFRRVDAGRHVARARVPARARRHRGSQHQGRAEGEARQAGAARHATERSRRSTATAGKQVEPHRPGGRRRAPQAHQPRSHLLAGRSANQAAGADEARPGPLSRRRVAPHAAASARPAADDDPHARRHHRRALLPEALGAGASGFRGDGERLLRAQGREASVRRREQSADAAVARAERHAGVPRLALARQRGARTRPTRTPTTTARKRRSKTRC